MREPLSKKTRFQVFCRDGFTCQYCRREGEEIKLRVDHIFPVSAGGGNELFNLVTSCHDCNAGKSDEVLLNLGIRYHALRCAQSICDELERGGNRGDAGALRMLNERFFALRRWIDGYTDKHITRTQDVLHRLATEESGDIQRISWMHGHLIEDSLDHAISQAKGQYWFRERGLPNG